MCVSLITEAPDPGPLDWGLLAGVGIVWFVSVIAGGPRSLSTLVVVLGATAWTQALAANPPDVMAQNQPVVAWGILAAVAAGLTWSGPAGVGAVLVIAGGEASILVVGAASGGAWDQAWTQVVAVSAFALADGMAAVTAAAALRRAAFASDSSATTLAQLLAEAAAAEARLMAAQRATRILHDTVVNTLGLIRRGIDPRDEAAVRERCRNDAAGIADLWLTEPAASAVPLESLLVQLRGRAGILGLELREHLTITSDAPIPGTVAAAAIAGGSESLLNVAKHAGVETADIFVTWGARGLDLEVVDAGRGWAGEIPTGRGLDSAVRGPATSAGMFADVTSSVGGGTTVHLHWDAFPEAWHDTEDPAITGDWEVDPARAIAAAAAGVSSWALGLFAVLTALAWPVIPSWGSLVAMAVVGAVVALGWLVARGVWPYPVAWPVAAAMTFAVGAVAVLPVGAGAKCAQVGVGWWGAEGALAILMILATVTATRAWAVAGGAVFVAGVLAFPLGGAGLPAGCEGLALGVLALNLGIFTAILMMSSLLSRLWHDVRSNRRAVRDQHVEAAIRAALKRARDARVDALLVEVVPLLDGVSTGRLGPSEPAVKRRCAVAEEALRALMQLGPEPRELAAALADLAVHAVVDDKSLTLTRPPEGQTTCPSGVVDLLRRVLDAVPAGGTMSVAVLSEPGTHMLSIACRPPHHPILDGDSDHVRQDVTVVQIPAGDTESYTEIRWPS